MVFRLRFIDASFCDRSRRSSAIVGGFSRGLMPPPLQRPSPFLDFLPFWAKFPSSEARAFYIRKRDFPAELEVPDWLIGDPARSLDGECRINHPAKGPAPPESILFSVWCSCFKKKEKTNKKRQVVVVLHNKNPPTPCLWQAPASTQKTKRKTRPAIRRSARWRVDQEKEGDKQGTSQ